MNKLQIIFLILCIFYFLPINYVYSAPKALKEHQVKATFVHSFTNFIKWPKNTFDSKQESLEICVIGKNPFGKLLDMLAKKHNSRASGKMNPHKINYLDRDEDFSHCHLLYFSDSEKKYFQETLNKIKQKPILTISSIKDFVINGGMIQFYLRNKRVRFLIDPQTMRESKLTADANLLRIADIAEK